MTTVLELLTAVGLEGQWPNFDKTMAVDADTVEKFNAEKTQVLQAFIISNFVNGKIEEEIRKANAESEESRKKLREDERDKKKEEDRRATKFRDWALEKFVVPETGAYLSGKLCVWLQEFLDYVETEKIDDQTAIKALKLKSGDYLKKQMMTIRMDSDTSSTSSSRGGETEDKKGLKYILEVLRKKAVELEDPAVAVRKECCRS